MLITYSQEQFETDGGFYYSPSFKSGKYDNNIDIYITVEAISSGLSTVSMQTSIDDVNWYDSTGSEFECDPSGLQQYKDAQNSLHYRLKGTNSFLSAKILV